MIVEAMIAFVIALVALIGILNLANRSVATSGTAVRAARATGYADETIEWLKNQKAVLGWHDFLQKSDPAGVFYCLDELILDASKVYDPAVGDCTALIAGTTEYTRMLILRTSIVGGKTLVTAQVTVGWFVTGAQLENVNRQYEFVQGG